MLRRPPTLITLTQDDIAIYEETRLARLARNGSANNQDAHSDNSTESDGSSHGGKQGFNYSVIAAASRAQNPQLYGATRGTIPRGARGARSAAIREAAITRAMAAMNRVPELEVRTRSPLHAVAPRVAGGAIVVENTPPRRRNVSGIPQPSSTSTGSTVVLSGNQDLASQPRQYLHAPRSPLSRSTNTSPLRTPTMLEGTLQLEVLSSSEHYGLSQENFRAEAENPSRMDMDGEDL